MPTDSVVDTSQIRTELGYREILSEDEAIRDLIDWIRRSRAGKSG
jgi:hypothetical protein